MFSQIEKLLYQRYVFHTQKFELFHALDPKSYMRSVKTLNRIHLILTQERYVNTKLLRALSQVSFSEEIRRDFAQPISLQLFKINKVLAEENTVLCQANVFRYGYSSLQKLVTGKQNSFHRQLKLFSQLAHQELVLHREILSLSQRLPKNYRLQEQEVRGSWKLVQELQEELHGLARAIGNAALVKKQGEHVLTLILSIQKTEVYEFIKQDIVFIKSRVEYIMEHPQENRLAYFLASVYIIAPGTFEMTGIILFFRYLGKYTMSKTRKFGKRFRKASLR